MKKVLFLGVLISLLFGACKKEVQQPTLPPSSTMELNDSEFQGTEKFSETRVNWFVAATQVAFWSTAIKLTFAIPVYAYKHALDQQPVQVDDNTWLWEYSVHYINKDLIVKLYGTVEGEKVTWTMYVNDFKWFEGENDLAVTNGYWIFYKKDDTTESEALLRIDWTYNHTDSTGTAKYTIIDPNHEAYNSYIEYGNNLTGLYDCYFNIYLTKDTLTKDTSSSEIRWNSENHSGAIRCEKFYKDTLWHCWDENLNDCDCPVITK